MLLVVWMFWPGAARAEAVVGDPALVEDEEQVDDGAGPDAPGDVLIQLPTPPEDQLRGADIKVHGYGSSDPPAPIHGQRDPTPIPTHRVSSPGNEAGIRTHPIGGDDQSQIRTHGLGSGDSSGIKVHR
jgi:hypothetical protein